LRSDGHPAGKEGLNPIELSFLDEGTRNISVRFNGNKNYLSSVAPTSFEVVVKRAFTDRSSAPVNTPVKFDAGRGSSKQAPRAMATAATPGDTVTFKDGDKVLATVGFDATGVASYTTSSLAVGVHTISAIYSGDATHLPYTTSSTQTIYPTRYAELTPAQPANWIDKIPVGVAQLAGTSTHGYSGPYYSNQPLYFNCAVLNQGNTSVNHRLHIDVTGPVNKTFDWTVGSRAGDVMRLSSDIPLGILPAGTYTITMTVDAAKTNAEKDEFNNVYQRTFSVVPPPPQPDLTPAQPTNWNNKIPVGVTAVNSWRSHTYNGPFYSNQTLYINWAASNQGTATASKYTVHVDVAGPVKKSFDWTNLATSAGATQTLPSDLALGTLSAGTYTITLTVDSASGVSESNESNNVYQRTFTVLPAPKAAAPSTHGTPKVLAASRTNPNATVGALLAMTQKSTTAGGIDPKAIDRLMGLSLTDWRTDDGSF
jgi:hypothetical protein